MHQRDHGGQREGELETDAYKGDDDDQRRGDGLQRLVADLPPERRAYARHADLPPEHLAQGLLDLDRKSTRLNSSHANISYAVFCLKKKNNTQQYRTHISS